MLVVCILSSSFFFNDTATTEIYTLSLHDALPIYQLPVDLVGLGHAEGGEVWVLCVLAEPADVLDASDQIGDRKSTRLNSSHSQISYAVFCLKKKKEKTETKT